MKRVALSTIAVLVTTAAAAALAGSPRGLLRMDTDGDGMVSRAEFQPPEAYRGRGPMAEADADGDGVVSREEMESAVERRLAERGEEMRARMTERFDAVDANGDGFVTEEEMASHAFDRVDANGDGFITREEARDMRRGRDGHRGRGRRGEARGDAWSDVQSDG